MRQLSFLSKSLEPGNVCPACPKVGVLCYKLTEPPALRSYLHTRTQELLFTLLMDYRAKDLLGLVIGNLFMEDFSLWISVLLMNTLVLKNCIENKLFRYLKFVTGPLYYNRSVMISWLEMHCVVLHGSRHLMKLECLVQPVVRIPSSIFQSQKV